MEDRCRSRFWTIFDRISGMKNEQKCRRVCLFLSFEVFKMSPDFDSNLEASWASFSDVFGRQKTVLSENIDFRYVFLGV